MGRLVEGRQGRPLYSSQGNHVHLGQVLPPACLLCLDVTGPQQMDLLPTQGCHGKFRPPLWTAHQDMRPCAIGGGASGDNPPATTAGTPHVVPLRTTASFVLCEGSTFAPGGAHNGAPIVGSLGGGLLGQCLATACIHNRAALDCICSMVCRACTKKGAAGMSRASLGDETSVGASGNDGSLVPSHGI